MKFVKDIIEQYNRMKTNLSVTRLPVYTINNKPIISMVNCMVGTISFHKLMPDMLMFINISNRTNYEYWTDRCRNLYKLISKSGLFVNEEQLLDRHFLLYSTMIILRKICQRKEHILNYNDIYVPKMLNNEHLTFFTEQLYFYREQYFKFTPKNHENFIISNDADFDVLQEWSKMSQLTTSHNNNGFFDVSTSRNGRREKKAEVGGRG